MVNNFTNIHYENAHFVIGSTTTMIFEMSFSGLPVVIVNNDGFDMFKSIRNKSWIIIDNVNDLDHVALTVGTNANPSITKKFINSVS